MTKRYRSQKRIQRFFVFGALIATIAALLLPGLQETETLLENIHGEYGRLVNREYLLDEAYIPEDLVDIKVRKTSSSSIKMRQVASDALEEMFQEAKEEGVTLYAHSGYRSYKTQNTMYYNRLEKNKGKDDGAVAYPGSSDHQTGLGIDVISKAWIGKRFNADFAKTKEAQWMAENCWRYGFIIRYPEGKEEITKIIYEPWHLRYVGIEMAQYLTVHQFTLEEFEEKKNQPISDESQFSSTVEIKEGEERDEEEILWFDGGG